MTAREVRDASYDLAGLVELRSRAGGALIAATVLASMVGFIDAYMVNVAVPAISRDLHAGVSELQWVLTGYLITVAALLLLAGALADHFGWRRILVAGLALTEGPSSGWGSAEVLVSGAVGVVCLAGLVPVEQRRSAPMLRMALFRIRQFVAMLVMAAVSVVSAVITMLFVARGRPLATRVPATPRVHGCAVPVSPETNRRAA